MSSLVGDRERDSLAQIVGFELAEQITTVEMGRRIFKMHRIYTERIQKAAEEEALHLEHDEDTRCKDRALEEDKRISDRAHASALRYSLMIAKKDAVCPLLIF